ncbi:hypothetical protein [Deinococcus radiophilus]|uniref:Uncharacterized protein n=1 Tax=Deinococcus radiophilus TaxID=32062 RepID=A0A431VRK2_9DEIO|nr:hypothetical protein [Deinococcus radiophilus]RTR25723.1 hypothetical protein EJ104_09845 [Deinococcus radiophilus]UFA50204.1 hypothetical protein LMT64_10045 [Deinococcus radiophilus]
MTKSDDTTRDNETPTSGYVETDQQTEITEGMQGATGNADANGLDSDADPQEKLAELDKNLEGLKDL